MKKKEYIIKIYNEYIESGMIGTDISLSIKDKIKMLFCSKLRICLFGHEFKTRIPKCGERYIKKG